MTPLLDRSICRLRAARALFAVVASLLLVAPAEAARVGILSNRYAVETAADFNARISTHSFTAVETAVTVPSLQSLISNFDVLLLFEDATYGNATAVGNLVAAYAKTGRAVVIGAFYEQDRSDGLPANIPHGWGALEQLDPNTGDGFGTPYAPRALDTATLVRHPLTRGITSLTASRFAGGNQAKGGTTVVAWWTQPNARGLGDPAIAYRITGPVCITHVAIAPNYPALGTPGVDYSGDFHRAWRNAFDFAADGCVANSIDAVGPDPLAIPTLSPWGMALTVLLVAVMLPLRRRLLRR
jgi:IPTL-CTERM motif